MVYDLKDDFRQQINTRITDLTQDVMGAKLLIFTTQKL